MKKGLFAFAALALVLQCFEAKADEVEAKAEVAIVTENTPVSAKDTDAEKASSAEIANVEKVSADTSGADVKSATPEVKKTAVSAKRNPCSAKSSKSRYKSGSGKRAPSKSRRRGNRKKLNYCPIKL